MEYSLGAEKFCSLCTEVNIQGFHGKLELLQLMPESADCGEGYRLATGQENVAEVRVGGDRLEFF